MKKLFVLAMVLFGAIMVTSTPASAQVRLGIGRGGVYVGVGPRVAPRAYCYDAYRRPVYCQPAVPAYDEGYYGDDYGYAPDYYVGGAYPYGYYNGYYYGRRDYRGDYGRRDYGREYGRGGYDRGGNFGGNRGGHR